MTPFQDRLAKIVADTEAVVEAPISSRPYWEKWEIYSAAGVKTLGDFDVLDEISDALEQERLQGEDVETLRWLMMLLAERTLPSWAIYCDDDLPKRAVSAMNCYMKEGKEPASWGEFAEEAVPAYRGKGIIDCRFGDTSSAAECIACAAQLMLHFDAETVINILGAA